MEDLGTHIHNGHYGLLYLADKLQEGCHYTECDGSVTKLQSSPYEGQKISQAEGQSKSGPHYDGEAGTAQHVALELLLHIVQTAGNPFFAAHRTEHGVVFAAFLHVHLDAALVFSYAQRHLTELAADQLGQKYGSRSEDYQGPGQPAVEIAQQEKGSRELDESDDYLGDDIGKSIADFGDVF